MIKFYARGRCAQAVADNPVTTGSVGISVQFYFSPDWDALQKIAVFRAGDTAVDVALTGDTTTVPADVLTTAGLPLMIGVYGAAADGTVVIPTVWAKTATIKAGTAPSGVDPSEPTPSWVAQVQQIAEDAYNMANDVKEAAENGEFDGEPGENGVGVPAGGLPGMVLLKKSLTDYDTEWGLPPFEVDSYTFRAVYDDVTDSYTVTTGTGTTIAELWAMQEDGKTLVFIVNINSGEKILTSADVTFNTDGMDALDCIVRFGGDGESGFYQLSNSGSGWELRFVLFPASSGGAVDSVNGQTGTVVLTAADVGAGTYSKPSGGIPASDLAPGAIPTVPVQSVNGKTGSVVLDASDVGAATESYVDSAISQSTAFYRGNYATRAALLAVAWQTTNPQGANYVTNNDYAVVLDDETQGDECWRYIYVTGSGWLAQYRINETPLTQAQLDAVNSGATAAKINQIATNTAAISGKITAPSSPATGAFLIWDGSAWVAQTLATWQGGNY